MKEKVNQQNVIVILLSIQSTKSRRKKIEVTYNSEELIYSEEKCFLIPNEEHMKFCQLFLPYLQTWTLIFRNFI